jgi:hypothetical protein
VTGLKALNVNAGFVTGFAELKKKESGKTALPQNGHSESLTDLFV